MAQPSVLVLGSRGNMGSFTLQSLSDLFSDKVKIFAGTRDPSKLGDLAALKGVSPIRADINDLTSLSEAIKSCGASTVFVLPPAVENRAQLAAAAVAMCREAGANHVVTVSTSLAELPETIFGGQMSFLERKVKEVGLPYTVLRIPIYMEWHLSSVPAVKKDSTISNITPIDAPMGLLTKCDLGRAAATVLANPSAHINKIYNITSQPHTHADVIRLLSEHLGREIKYSVASEEDFLQAAKNEGFPDWQAKGVVGLWRAIADRVGIMSDPEAPATYKAITGIEPTTLQQWLPTVIESFK